MVLVVFPIAACGERCLTRTRGVCQYFVERWRQVAPLTIDTVDGELGFPAADTTKLLTTPQMNPTPPPQVPDSPGAFAVVFGAELRAVWPTFPFFASAARNAAPVIGVLFFDWPALQLALYFVIESWLMLSLYATTDLSFNPKYGGRAPQSLREAVLAPLPQFLAAAGLIAVFVGLFAGFLLVSAFGADEWDAFLRGGWTERSFLVGLIALVWTCLSEAVHFARRIPARTPEQSAADDLRVASLFYRVLLLFMVSAALGWTRGSPVAVPLFALALAIVLMFFETLPRSAAALLGIGASKSR